MDEVYSANSQQPSRTKEGTQQRENNSNNSDARRTKWTKEMNTRIVRSYFIAITTTPNTHRRAIFDLWNKKYDMNFSEQRICDQRRAIFLKARNEQNKQLRGSWLSQIETDTIPVEVNRLKHPANQGEPAV